MWLVAVKIGGPGELPAANPEARTATRAGATLELPMVFRRSGQLKGARSIFALPSRVLSHDSAAVPIWHWSGRWIDARSACV
jgi:hypothetical protein